MINIICNDYLYKFLDGSITTIFDVYLNLQKFKKNVKLNIISNDVGNFYQVLKSNNMNVLTKCLTQQTNYKSDVIIILYNLLTEKNGKFCFPLNITTKKLIILGTLDSFEYPFTKYLIPSHWDYDKIYFLNNPPTNLYIIYYHKLSEYRLDKLILKNEYKYSRRKKPHIFKNNIYFENIGKLIFEYSYHGKPVLYSNDGMTIKDGLYYYLKLFNIDGLKSQKIKITKEEIIKKLLMKKDDLLLQIIEK